MIDKNLNLNNLNGWAISYKLYEWIVENLSEGSTILELGSGKGTLELCKKYKVYSIEHDENWLGLAKDSNYIYAKIKNYGDYHWYDTASLDDLKNIKYDLILVDGPTGKIGRIGFLKHLDIFNTNVPIIFDDTNRIPEKELATEVSKKLGKKMFEIFDVLKAFTVINERASPCESVE